MRLPTVHDEASRPRLPLGAWAPESLTRRPDHTPAPPTRRDLWSGDAVGTHRLALASLALSILWLGGVGSALAIRLGHRARHQLAEHWQKGAGAATAGIVLGWVGLGAALIVAVVLVATPAALDQRLDEVERIARGFFDGRSAFD